MRHRRRRRLKMNCFGCGRFWRKKRQAFCDFFRLPLQYDKEDLLLRKEELQERLRNINRKLKELEQNEKPEDLEFGGHA